MTMNTKKKPARTMLENPEESSRDLYRQQKRELAIVNAIIQTLSSSYNLKVTLESALEIILSVLGSSAGWICLVDDHSCSSFVGSSGLCFADSSCGPEPCLARCVCGRVQSSNEIVVIHKLAPGCPLLAVKGGSSRQITGHISVPLTTKAHMVGQLNIAFTGRDEAGEMDIDLLKTIAPQLAVAVENARLWEQIQEKEEVRSQLLKKVVGAQEEERQRISRELHDELGQLLTSMLMRLQLLEKQDPGDSSAEIIHGLKTSTSAMLATIHDLARELRPIILDDLGLVPALTQYIHSCPENLGIQVDFEVIGSNGLRPPPEVETTIYRIIQESLTNVARHSQANKASVMLKFTNHNIVAIIEDNGIGFDLADLRSRPDRLNHLGLYGIEERVALVGGEVTIESSPGSGTNIFVEIPTLFS